MPRPLRLLTGCTCGLGVLAIALWTSPRWLVPLLAMRSRGCLYSVSTPERVVALTLDDGPDSVHTPEILDLLRANGARATFFLISGRVPGNERLVEEIVADGNEIGNHLTRDEPSYRLTHEEFAAAAREAGTVLGRFGTVRWLRPASGWYTRAMLTTMKQQGYRCALGSIYPYDAQISSASLSAAYIMSNVRPGSVIILHEGSDRGGRTVEVLRRVLPALRKRGFRVVSLSDLSRAGG
ncbi:MAG TPA: polysaccharide deacetylase family protein, partial [Gemmatimonadaceae bacterium]|nr:polysaccharide deacetylase family protein [Gemmatimonadaceae bacterium]